MLDTIELVMLGVAVVGVFALVVIEIWKGRQVPRVWDEVAQRLGVDADTSGSFHELRVRGTIDEIPVRIRGRREQIQRSGYGHSQVLYYLVIRAKLHAHLESVDIRPRESTYIAVGGNEGGVGYRGFDEHFELTGSPPSDVREMLSDPPLCRKLTSLAEQFERFEIVQGWLTVQKEPGRITDADRICELVEEIIAVARQFHQACDNAQKPAQLPPAATDQAAGDQEVW